MREEKIKLSNSDREKLTKLYYKAQTTPVIAFNLASAVEGKDMATLAWNHVREFIDKLGNKYGFDPTTISSINSKTGEVKRVEK